MNELRIGMELIGTALEAAEKYGLTCEFILSLVRILDPDINDAELSAAIDAARADWDF